MRHRKNTLKLGRTSAHREALLSNLVNSLILTGRIRTTVVKAKAARRLAERMVTLAKRQTLAAHRAAVARLRRKDVVKKLFATLGPAFRERAGGYTRVVRLGPRGGDNAEWALLEWVDYVPRPPAKKKKKEGEKPGAPPLEKGKGGKKGDRQS